MRSSFCSDCLSYFRKHLRSVTISYDDLTLRVITTDEADQYFSPSLSLLLQSLVTRAPLLRCILIIVTK